MAKLSHRRWLKLLSPLLITAMLLTSLTVFPTSVSAFTATLAEESTGSLGGSRYLLGEWISFTGQVSFADGEEADIESVSFIVDGPEPLEMQLPVEEGSYSYLDGRLLVTVTWTNMVSYGYEYGYSLEGGTGGGSINYEVLLRPPYLLSNPDAELPETDLAWEISDLSGLSSTRKPQGIASDGTNLYLLVDGTSRDLIIKTDINGNVLDSFNGPNKNTRGITYLDGYLYVYADDYQRVFDVVDEEPEYDQWVNRYRLSIADNCDSALVSGTLVVTVDGEVTDVTYYSDNREFEIDQSEIWDSDTVRGPDVVKLDDTTYHMWYYSDAGMGGMEKIGHATSTDGLTWTKDSANPVLVPGDTGAWDDGGVLHPSVVYDSDTSTFHMWYIGYSGSVRQVGHATSSDGATWTKDENNPVMSPGDAAAWDNSAIHSVDVIANGSFYEMWYAASSDYDFSTKIGYAYSNDGVTWQKLEANPENLTNNAAAEETSPSWSPDGTQIAYERDGDIWIMDADGSSLFIDIGGTEQDPAWSPDGTTIAFASDVTGNFEIWKADVATATATQVTFRPDNGDGVPIHDVEPTWSPDSAKIAFASSDPWGTPSDYDIWVVNADGTDTDMLHETPSACREPAWSPNGNWIAFSEDSNIRVFQPMAGGGSTNHNNLTNDFMATDTDPAWSPDGNRVMFSRNGDLWVLDFNSFEPWNSGAPDPFNEVNGSQQTEPAWSPSGEQIAYASDQTGDSDVWVIGTMANPIMTPDEWCWEENGIFSPTVLLDGSTYHMWYAGINNMDEIRIGHATSTDGKGWNKDGSNPVFNTQWHDFNWEDGDVTAPDVLKTTSYQMWYEGRNWDGNVVAIGKASSFNGSTWSRNPDNPVLQEGLQGATVLASYSYTATWPEHSIVKIDATDGSYVNHFHSPNWEKLGGLATDGAELYACRQQWGNEVYQINPDDGSYVSQWLNSDKGYWVDGGDALAYKDGDLYYGKGGAVYVIEWDTTNIYEKYDTGLTGINGLTFVGDVLYIGASLSPGKIYKSALPGTVEKSTIGDYEACIEVVGEATVTSDPVAFSLEALSEPVDLVVTSPEDGHASDSPDITIAGTVNDPSIDYVQVGIALPSTMLVDDDMESGDSVTGDGAFHKEGVPGEGWMVYADKNLWHLSDQRSFSGAQCWAYNNPDGWGFNTPGFANAGAIVSEPFNIGQDCQLNFWTSWDTDSWVEVDRKLIDIYVDGEWQPLAYIVDGDWYPDPFGGSRQRIIVPMAWMWKDPMAGPFSGDDPNWNWYEVSVDLGMYAGATDAQIRFRFDSMDDWMNDFEGWYIDDVTVEGAGFKGINAEVVDLAFSTSYTLAEGYNEITVTAQSGYIPGAEGRDSETLTVSLDTTGPVIDLDELPHSTGQGSIELSGTVYELNFDNLVVKINDKPFYTLTDIPDGQEAPEWTFSTQISLFEGENVIVATGTDAAGLTGSDTVSIIRDSTPPTIEVLPTVYFLGETAARPGDLLLFQVNVTDLPPEGTDYEPSGVSEVMLDLPGSDSGEGEGDRNWFIPVNELPEAITDQWGTTGEYVMPMRLPDDAPPGTYSLPIRATDNAGNEATGTVTALIVSTLSAYNIYLMPEWNLISLPLIPDDNDIGNLLGSVRGVESVWYYDAASATWQVYTTGDAPDSLTTMETGKGYWVYMNEEDFEYSAPLDYGLPPTPAPIKFSYTGQVLEPATAPPTYSLEPGWNLIGLHSERAKEVSLYLRPVTVPQQVWASLLQYDNYISFEMGEEEGEGGAEIYLGCFRTLLDTDSMEPGKGYWIYLVEPGEVVAQP